jgi:hypothetical protein
MRRQWCGYEKRVSARRMNDRPNVRPQRRSRARCWGASSSGNGRPTKVTVSAPLGNVAWLSLMGLGRQSNVRHAGGEGCFTGDARLAVPREIHPSKVAHATIRVKEMSSMSAYSTSCAPGPIMGVGRDRSYNVCRVGGRMVYWLKRGMLSGGKGGQ